MSSVITDDFGMFSSYLVIISEIIMFLMLACIHWFIHYQVLRVTWQIKTPFRHMAPQDRDEIPFTVVVVGLCVLAASCGLKAKTEQRPT